MPAGWAYASSPSAVEAVQVRVEVGRATAVCLHESGQEPTVFLPVAISSSDGRVSGEWAASVEGEEEASGRSITPSIHQSEFQQVTGVNGIELDESEAAHVRVGLTRRATVLSGFLGVTAHAPGAPLNTDFRVLHWGSGLVSAQP